MPDSTHGCGKFFCADHLVMGTSDEQLCQKCAALYESECCEHEVHASEMCKECFAEAQAESYTLQ